MVQADEPPLDASLLEALERELHRSPRDWTVRPAVDGNQPWISAQVPGTTVPEQGWKIHVSSYERTAFETLERILPLVIALGLPLKVLGSLAWLRRINLGGAGLSQVGKFITIYPPDETTAVALATSLTDATRGLRGPRIPSDRPVEPGGVVHYRYGGFGDRVMQTRLGEVVPALVDRQGRLVPDHRRTAPYQPSWVEDPFRAAGLGSTPSLSALVAGRYQPVMILSHTPGVVVQLALDVEKPRPCILKRAVDERRERLREEARLLRRLAPTGVAPQLYDVVDDDELLLVIEDLGAQSLEREVRPLVQTGRVLPNERIVELGVALADALSAIHDEGYIHGDVKSANVLLGEDGRLRLIDFDIAQAIGSKDRPPSAGTRGYTSPECREGKPAAVTDDIFAAGALLYFLATGAEPSRAPDEDDLLARPPALINPRASGALVAVVERCLSRDLGARHGSARELRDALIATRGKDEPAQAVAERFSAESAVRQVVRAADAICARAEPFGGGVAWRSHYFVGKGLIGRDLNSGTAGTILALAEIVDELRIPRHATVLQEAAKALSEFAQFPGDHPAGLYVGEAGVAAALLRAGQVLEDPELLARAVELGRASAGLPIESPDLFHGTAGRLLVHLLLWDETGEREDLDAAIGMGASLVSESAPWVIPPGYSSLSGKSYLGYAHGAAGIADVLLDLFEATGDSRVVAVASDALAWLERQAVPTRDGDGVAWPLVEGGHPHPPFWCHGATGIGRAFLHADRLGLLPDRSDLVRRAALSAASDARWSGPTLCHGLAGNAEFLLDVAGWTGEPPFLDAADRLLVLAGAYARESEDGCTWITEPPHQITPDYLVGYCGIALVLLRRARPERPHVLSRAAFRYHR